MKTKKRGKTAYKRRNSRSRPVHKRVLFHPFTVFFWLCTGVFLAILSFKAFAGNQVALTVRVAGPPPSSPAKITSPTDSQRFTKIPITVTGECENYSYVKLFRNDIFSGTASCDSVTSFQITTNLSPGANVLVPRIYNFADAEGPEPTSITVHYDQPVEPAAPGGPSNDTDKERPSGNKKILHSPLVLLSDFSYKGHYVDSKVKFDLELRGGQLPYQIEVQWGDENTDKLTLEDSGKFAISHIYSEAGTYTVIVKATDKSGDSTMLQLFSVIVPLPPAAGNNSSTNNDNLLGCNYEFVNDPNASLVCFGSGFMGRYRDAAKYVLPGYLITSLMVISYWLGEKEEIFKINHRHRPRKA